VDGMAAVGGIDRPAPPRFGAFLAAAEWFDAGLFGVAATEATQMDPQQRLLLEVAAEAVSVAGTAAPCYLSREWMADAAVFVGLSSTDYAKAVAAHAPGTSVHTATGTAMSVAAGRLSYCIGLKGPSVTVDTACSSSLVSLHLALTAMANGECKLVGSQE
jgi:polyketide synthase